MEENKKEKKPAKMSLIAFVLLIINFVLIIAIIYLCAGFAKIKVENDNTIKDLKQALKDETDTNLKLQKSITDLQGKIDDIDATINGGAKTTEPEEKNESKTQESKLSEEKATELVDWYLTLCAIGEGGGPQGQLNFLNIVDNVEVDRNDTIKVGNLTRFKTNIKYDDFENEMLKHLSKNMFENGGYNIYSRAFVNENGILYIDLSGGTGYDDKVIDITLSEENGKYKFVATRETTDITDVPKQSKVNGFIIEENGRFVIDEFSFGNN